MFIHKSEDNSIVNGKFISCYSFKLLSRSCGFKNHWTLHESSLFCPALEGNRSCKTYNVRTKTYNFRTNVSNVHTVSSTIYRLLTLQQIYNIYNHSTFKNPLLIITNPLPVCMYSFIFLLVLRRIQSNLILFISFELSITT